jgi:hypothetical protein
MKMIVLSSSSKVDFNAKLDQYSEDNYGDMQLAIVIDG